MDLQALRSMKDQDQKCCSWTHGHLAARPLRRERISVHAVDNLRALSMGLPTLVKLKQVFRLDLETNNQADGLFSTTGALRSSAAARSASASRATKAAVSSHTWPLLPRHFRVLPH